MPNNRTASVTFTGNVSGLMGAISQVMKALQSMTDQMRQSGNASTQASQQTQAAMNQTAQSARASAQAFQSLMQNVSNMAQGAQGQLSQLQASWGRITAAAGAVREVMGGIGIAVVAAAAAGVAAFAGFEQQMNMIYALAGTTRQEYEKLSAAVLASAPALGRAPKELADGLYFVVSAGFQASESMDILTAATKASAAEGANLHIVADGLTSIMQAYGVAAGDAENVTDMMTRAVIDGKLEFANLAGSIGRVAPIAKIAGLSIAEMLASLTVMTRSGLSAEEAATALRQALNNLEKPSKQSADALAEIGMSADQVRAEIRERGLVGALQDLYEKTNGNLDILGKIIPNIRGLTGVLSLASAGWDTYRQVLGEVENSQGLTEASFAKTSETLAFKIKQVESTLQSIAITVGSVFAPALKSAIDNIVGFTQAIAGYLQHNPEIATNITHIVTLTGAFLALLGGARALQAAIYLLGVSFGPAFIGLRSANLAIMELLGPIGLVTAAILGLKVAAQTNIPIVSDLAEAFEALPNPVQLSVVEVGVLLLLLPKLVTLVSGVAAGFELLIPKITATIALMAQFGIVEAITALFSPLGLVIAGVTAAFVALDAAIRIITGNGIIERLIGAFAGWVRGAAGVKEATAGVSDELDRLHRSALAADKSLQLTGAQSATEAAVKLNIAMAGVNAAIDDAAPKAAILTNAQNNLAQAFNDARTKGDFYGESQSKVREAQGELTQAQQALNTALGGSTVKVEAATKMIKEMMDADQLPGPTILQAALDKVTNSTIAQTDAGKTLANTLREALGQSTASQAQTAYASWADFFQNFFRIAQTSTSQASSAFASMRADLENNVKQAVSALADLDKALKDLGKAPTKEMIDFAAAEAIVAKEADPAAKKLGGLDDAQKGVIDRAYQNAAALGLVGGGAQTVEQKVAALSSKMDDGTTIVEAASNAYKEQKDVLNTVAQAETTRNGTLEAQKGQYADIIQSEKDQNQTLDESTKKLADLDQQQQQAKTNADTLRQEIKDGTVARRDGLAAIVSMGQATADETKEVHNSVGAKEQQHAAITVATNDFGTLNDYLQMGNSILGETTEKTGGMNDAFIASHHSLDDVAGSVSDTGAKITDLGGTAESSGERINGVFIGFAGVAIQETDKAATGANQNLGKVGDGVDAQVLPHAVQIALAIRDTLTQNTQIAVQQVDQLLSLLGNGAVTPAVSRAIAMGQAILATLLGSAQQAVAQTDATLSAIGAGAEGAAYSNGVAIGANLDAGIFQGIAAGSGAVAAAAAGAVNAAIAAANAAGEIHSPSKKTKQTGNYLMEGIALGVDESTADTVGKVADSMGKVVDVFTKALELLPKLIDVEITPDTITAIQHLAELIHEAVGRVFTENISFNEIGLAHVSEVADAGGKTFDAFSKIVDFLNKLATLDSELPPDIVDTIQHLAETIHEAIGRVFTENIDFNEIGLAHVGEVADNAGKLFDAFAKILDFIKKLSDELSAEEFDPVAITGYLDGLSTVMGVALVKALAAISVAALKAKELNQISEFADTAGKLFDAIGKIVDGLQKITKANNEDSDFDPIATGDFLDELATVGMYGVLQMLDALRIAGLKTRDLQNVGTTADTMGKVFDAVVKIVDGLGKVQTAANGGDFDPYAAGEWLDELATVGMAGLLQVLDALRVAGIKMRDVENAGTTADALGKVFDAVIKIVDGLDKVERMQPPTAADIARLADTITTGIGALTQATSEITADLIHAAPNTGTVADNAGKLFDALAKVIDFIAAFQKDFYGKGLQIADEDHILETIFVAVESLNALITRLSPELARGSVEAEKVSTAIKTEFDALAAVVSVIQALSVTVHPSLVRSELEQLVDVAAEIGTYFIEVMPKLQQTETDLVNRVAPALKNIFDAIKGLFDIVMVFSTDTSEKAKTTSEHSIHDAQKGRDVISNASAEWEKTITSFDLADKLEAKLPEIEQHIYHAVEIAKNILTLWEAEFATFDVQGATVAGEVAQHIQNVIGALKDAIDLLKDLGGLGLEGDLQDIQDTLSDRLDDIAQQESDLQFQHQQKLADITFQMVQAFQGGGDAMSATENLMHQRDQENANFQHQMAKLEHDRAAAEEKAQRDTARAKAKGDIRQTIQRGIDNLRKVLDDVLKMLKDMGDEFKEKFSKEESNLNDLFDTVGKALETLKKLIDLLSDFGKDADTKMKQAEAFFNTMPDIFNKLVGFLGYIEAGTPDTKGLNEKMAAATDAINAVWMIAGSLLRFADFDAKQLASAQTVVGLLPDMASAVMGAAANIITLNVDPAKVVPALQSLGVVIDTMTGVFVQVDDLVTGAKDAVAGVRVLQTDVNTFFQILGQIVQTAFTATQQRETETKNLIAELENLIELLLEAIAKMNEAKRLGAQLAAGMSGQGGGAGAGTGSGSAQGLPPANAIPVFDDGTVSVKGPTLAWLSRNGGEEAVLPLYKPLRAMQIVNQLLESGKLPTATGASGGSTAAGMERSSRGSGAAGDRPTLHVEQHFHGTDLRPADVRREVINTFATMGARVGLEVS